MLIIAHRGASAEAPENTMAAFDRAWECRADGIELDVQLSRDGKVVVMHDTNTLRTTGVNRLVRALSSREIAKLDAGSWKGKEWKGEPAPTLEAVLRRLPADKRVFVEIKCGPEIIPSLRALMKKAGSPMSRVIFVGFSLPVMAKVKKAFPGNLAIWNVEFQKNVRNREWAPDPAGVFLAAIHAGMNGIGPRFDPVVTRAFVQSAHRAGLKVFLWCSDNPADVPRLKKWEVDWLVTNQPKAMQSSNARII